MTNKPLQTKSDTTNTKKVAVITGASRGIGAQCALLLSQSAMRVALLARNEEDLHTVAAAIQTSGGECLAIRTDVTKEQDISNAAQKIRTRWGKIDAVINNAGDVLTKALVECTQKEWEHIFSVNTTAPFLIAKEFAKDLISTKGRLINVASISGKQGTPLLSAYCASKHALLGMTRSLAKEWKSNSVLVCAVCPGSVNTHMLQRAFPGAIPDMQPQDIANVIRYLATDAPFSMTGSCIDSFG